MSNSGKIWDTREAYKQIRNNTWEQKGDLGFLAGGDTPSGQTNVINKVQVSTNGNAVDYGDLTVARGNIGGNAGGSFTRGIYCGGTTPSNSNVIDYITYTTTGNAVDFGDMSFSGYNLVSASDNTRLVIPQGDGRSDASYYLTIATQGNSASFATLTDSTIAKQTLSSPTRLVCAGGTTSPTAQTVTMQYLTIQSIGNAIDFGDLNFASRNGCANSNGVRGLMSGGLEFFGGGNPNNGDFNNIDFFTIASTGNATDFGDLNPGAFGQGGVTNGTRALFAGGGSYPDASTYYTSIQTVDFNTTGNTTDFGDLSTATQQNGGSGNGHGGLLAGVQRQSVTYMPGSGRGFINPGSNSGGSGGSIDRIQMIFVPTLGNALDFGDLSVARQLVAATNSLTRSCVAGGESPSTIVNTIDCYEMQSLGNAADFGDLTVARRSFLNGGTNGSRGTFHGGNTPSVTDVIDYITIATAGNATDFGNLTVAREASGTFSSPTRTVSGGGYAGGDSNVIDYITTASTGNATDFGDLTVARYQPAPVSSTTRGVWIAGYAPGVGSTRTDVMDYVTIASTGNATDFGDLAQARAAGAGISNNIRGVYAGGEVPGGDTAQIEFITIANTGNSSDFGDLVEACQYLSGTCDANSGLQS
jgi:hypothetical protein